MIGVKYVLEVWIAKNGLTSHGNGTPANLTLDRGASTVRRTAHRIALRQTVYSTTSYGPSNAVRKEDDGPQEISFKSATVSGPMNQRRYTSNTGLAQSTTLAGLPRR